MPRVLNKTQQEMVETGARFCQLVGLPRTTGQIYGLLYLATQPLSLDDMVEALGISKASTSNGTRQLLSWGAIRQVWVHGDRKDYYEVELDLKSILMGGYKDFAKPRISSSQKRLDQLVLSLEVEFAEGNCSEEEYKTCLTRLKNLERLQRKFRRLLPLAEKWFF